jgi:hypothetical protein
MIRKLVSGNPLDPWGLQFYEFCKFCKRYSDFRRAVNIATAGPIQKAPAASLYVGDTAQHSYLSQCLQLRSQLAAHAMTVKCYSAFHISASKHVFFPLPQALLLSLIILFSFHRFALLNLSSPLFTYLCYSSISCDRLCGLVVRVPGYTTEMYCVSCEVRTKFTYDVCYVEESRPPLWSSGQSSWLHNGDVLCFLWGTN